MGAGGSALDPDAVRRLFARAAAEVEQGHMPSCQLAVARGDALETATFGAPDRSRFLLYSLTKSLVAGGLWVLFGEGALSPSQRVSSLIPEFAAHGKESVTVEHLLTHTAGFPRATLRPQDGATSAGRVAQFARWELEWEPGTQTAYHPTSAHWVLAEVIERVAGIDYRTFLHDRIVAPLGVPALRVGVPEDEQDDIADVAVVGEAPASLPAGIEDSAFFAETGARLLLRYNDPALRAIGVPGAGGVGSAADMARYFQAMLHNTAGVWDPEVLQDATGRVHNALVDPVTQIPANRTLGLMVAGDDGNAWMREVGQAAGPRTFVSSGAGGQVAWADPDTGLSFCYLTSGIAVDVVQSFLRSSALSTLAAACAGS